MELVIYSPSDDGYLKEIKWNNEEIKAEVAERMSYYRDLAYTDDQMNDAKKDRAKLNNFVKALEDKRREVKKQCLAPYEQFEHQIKEVIAIVNEPIRLIDEQIKSYEQQQKDEKLKKIREVFESTGFQSFVTFEMVFDSRWLNKSVSFKSIQDQLLSRMYAIGNDVLTISQLPEFSFEAMEVYKATLDINKAIAEGVRLADIQKRKEAYEAEQAAARSATEQVNQSLTESNMDDNDQHRANVPETVANVATEPTSDKQWVSFKALLSVDDAHALNQFFKSRNIVFEAI